MKEKKVGDIIVFDYDVYDIENNIEEVYDHTDTLMGVVEEVIPNARYTQYRVKLTRVINAASLDDYADYIGTNHWIASDDKVYRGRALFNLLYPTLTRPTLDQVKFIMNFFNDPNDAESIVKNWYKYVMGDLYDGEEFGEPQSIVNDSMWKRNETPGQFFKKLKEEIMKDFESVC